MGLRDWLVRKLMPQALEPDDGLQCGDCEADEDSDRFLLRVIAEQHGIEFVFAEMSKLIGKPLAIGIIDPGSVAALEARGCRAGSSATLQ